MRCGVPVEPQLRRARRRQPAVDQSALPGGRGHRTGSGGRAEHRDAGAQQLSRWRGPLSRGHRQPADIDRGVLIMKAQRILNGLTSLLPLALVSAMLVSCSKKPAETEPVVTVQIAVAQRGAIQQVISAEAVLFPRDQAAITPKVGAPVKEIGRPAVSGRWE